MDEIDYLSTKGLKVLTHLLGGGSRLTSTYFGSTCLLKTPQGTEKLDGATMWELLERNYLILDEVKEGIKYYRVTEAGKQAALKELQRQD